MDAATDAGVPTTVVRRAAESRRNVDARRDADRIDAELRELATPGRAEAERAYLKSSLVHYGTSVPDTRRTVKRYLGEHQSITRGELIAVCAALWNEPVHERRLATVELLSATPGLLEGGDLPWIEQRLRESKTWALVDEMARKVVGRIVADDTTQLTTLDRWLVDDDFWIRRSAILGLTQLLRADRELDRFFRYADTLLPEKEFFIRKAIGWMAREVGRRHPEDVSAWLRRSLGRMNGVTLREAVKYVPDGGEITLEWSLQPRRR